MAETRMPLPEGADEIVFAEPWQAQAFALAVGLADRGVFTWAEWTRAFGEELARARAEGQEDTAPIYFELWLAALEKLAVERGLASPGRLAALKEAWAEAYAATPHGQPVELPKGSWSK